MRSAYREKRSLCGENYMEVDLYPVYKQSRSRRVKMKPSTEAQVKLNQRRAERKLEMLIKTNFTPDDIKCELTYRPENHPESEEAAQKCIQNFTRRMKYFRERHGLSKLKYIHVTEKGSRKGRYHHHIIMSGGVSPREIAEIWGLGYVQKIQPLQFDEFGVVGIAKYMCKQMVFGKRWCASRNLKKPTESKNDSKYSRRKVIQVSEHMDDREYIEALYPGWHLGDCRRFGFGTVKEMYLTIRLYKPWKDGNNEHQYHRKRTRSDPHAPRGRT